MLKRKFSLRNVTIVVCLAVCAMMSFNGCKDDNDDNGSGGGSHKLSPPAWIRGSWGEEGFEFFKFTANDVVVAGVSFNMMFANPGVTYSFKETKNDALYEIKVTAKSSTGETAAGTFSFKKGDGTYIEVATAEGNDSIKPSDYERYEKL